MTTTSRIAPIAPPNASLLTRIMYRVTKRRYGQVPEPFTVIAHHRKLMVAAAVHEQMLGSASQVLPTSVRELAVFWTARTVGCSWCVDFGSMLQRLDGLDVDRLKAIDDYATSPLYTEDERVAIAYADAMTGNPHDIIGVENMRARTYAALGITEQGFNSGDACRVPWATSPDPMGT
ncbi:carboxymuconolactone decarboxylase family protein [Mycobacteroides abscessus]|uniref:carboxymuconolactone decarboxylase family protein n=1 Tax=Mycobacteroides abscessus TaxID=36809 RepID=UPI0009412B9D|nr:carboxymuconolactone decarboxylase family protein [Mycobacteroides abscessus]